VELLEDKTDADQVVCSTGDKQTACLEFVLQRGVDKDRRAQRRMEPCDSEAQRTARTPVKDLIGSLRTGNSLVGHVVRVPNRLIMLFDVRSTSLLDAFLETSSELPKNQVAGSDSP